MGKTKECILAQSANYKTYDNEVRVTRDEALTAMDRLELQINEEWAKQCAEISEYGEQMLTESRRLLEKCIKSFEMQGVKCDELKKHCFMIDKGLGAKDMQNDI